VKIENIIVAISANQIKIADHADEEAFEDRLTLARIIQSVQNGEIIEDYPKDKPYPSCLIYGNDENGNPIHSVWAYNTIKGWAVLITVYCPDPKKWIKWKIRRGKNEIIRYMPGLRRRDC
jgi:hypothetical protein